MGEDTGILPGLPAVAGKPVHVGFDGGRLTSDGGILLLAAIEQRLQIAARLAACLDDRRDQDRVVHQFAEMIRYRALLIAAGYPDGNDCDALKSDPAFKMAVGRLPESGDDLCSQPSISRLENLPGATALKRMMAAMVDLFCDSFTEVPRRILLDPRLRACEGFPDFIGCEILSAERGDDVGRSTDFAGEPIAAVLGFGGFRGFVAGRASRSAGVAVCRHVGAWAVLRGDQVA